MSAGKGSDTAATGTDERIELSLPREAFQFVKSTVRELEPSPVDEYFGKLAAAARYLFIFSW